MGSPPLLTFLVFLACVSPGSGRAEKTYTFKEPGKTMSTLALLYVDTSANNGDPLAVCNDGSQGAFWFAPARSPEFANQWLVYLQGGMWCYSQETCEQRAQQTPFLVSSVGLEHSVSMSGVFDTDPKRSPLAGANKVYVAYCSSDAWAGDAGPDSNPMGWQFRGQRIVNATFHTLAEQHGLGTLPHTKVVFGGCSAGSRGAMFNLDVVANAVVPRGVQVVGLLDSPLWVDVQPFGDNPQVMPLENETQMIVPYINPTLVLDPDCVAAYPGAENWRCLYGEYRLPFIKTPYLLSASQFDKYQLSYNEAASPPYTGDALTYADAFQSTVRGVLAGLPTPQQAGSAVFSTACFKHCTSDIGDFWGVKVGRISLKTWMAAWLIGQLPQPQLVEDCTGFGCGQCHSEPAADAETLGELYPSPPPPTAAAQPTGRGRRGRTPTPVAVKAPAPARVAAPRVAAGPPPPAMVQTHATRLQQIGRNLAVGGTLIAGLGLCLGYASRVVRKPPTVADDLEQRRLLAKAAPTGGKWGFQQPKAAGGSSAARAATGRSPRASPRGGRPAGL
jgi:hypothetical protein